ncbi:hypothetical protein GCM10010297_45560 [Streptomyces malachitofuscus]|nr:hypothetical protein GCM10010297_45560 [Streptomyces malachitofuscus]
MTQSGQGEEPSARPAREGIVLPSDGGEPLLPGMTAGPVAPGGGAEGRPSAGGFPASAPPGGQTWGTPWGPDQQNPGPPAGQDWTSPSDGGQWGAPEGSSWDDRNAPLGGAQGPGPLPPENAPARPDPGYGTHPGADPSSAGHGAGGAYGADASSARHGSGGPYGADAPSPGHGAGGAYGPGPSSAGQGSGGSYGADASAGHGGHPPYGSGAGYGAQPGGHGASAPLPPGAGQSGQGAHAAGHGAPAPHAYGFPAGGAPDGPEGATQFLPPVPAGGADEGATQYIPPVGPGALPPEMPATHDSEATRYLGLPPQNAPGAGNPDAEATQYIAPVTGQPYGAPAPPPGEGNRQPPAEFDNLFRSDDGGPAGSTQQLPRVEYGGPAPAAPAPRAAAPAGSGRSGRGGGSGTRIPVIAAVGIGIAVLGVGAGALLGSGGGEDDDSGNQTVSATAPATEEASPSPSVDPAREQAVELDKLLADSGDSRTAVINAVADVKACRDLGAAAKDLRDAAGQRSRLVTDLSALSVDKLPDHQALTSALTKAWQASASADNHYAAWADQVAGAKGKFCKKGQARATKQTQAGNRDSGTATTEKGKAAQLWNAIAKQYGLTERQPTQL